MAKEIRKKGTREVASITESKRNVLGFFWLPAALILALSAGGMTGVLLSYYLNNSRYATEVAALATYRPPEVTKIFADDGETVLAEFALEKRFPIREQEIPKVVEEALLAIEDIRFYDHIGIDPYRIAGATVKNLTSGRMEGASTITQQLAKNLFLTKEQTYTRKLSEWMMSLEIERFYTKRQILEMYMNYVFLGAGAYGFEAGAKTYFGKSLKDVNLEEAALLAAIPKSPEYSPTRNLKKAQERRDTVLDQMAKYGKISEAEAEAAKAKPIKLADTAYYQSQPKSTAWDYPVEEVRQYLEEKYTTRVAQGGLKVYTTINIEGQQIATRVVRERLRRFDQHEAWRSDYQDILVDEDNAPITDAKEIQRKLTTYKHADWYGDEYEKGEYVKGLVMEIDGAKNEAKVRFGKYNAVVTSKNMGRCRKGLKDELKAGFLGEFEILAVDKEKQTLVVQLAQVPEVQAAIVCINSKNGEIVTMVGGYDYHTNRFNNATQGLRQTGSAFKPFIYTAAVEWGMTPDMLVSGAPIRRGGWMPHNYDGSLSHPNAPMKIALAKSYNLAAVHLLDQIGIQTGAQMVRRFGITRPMAPVLPSALGATEVPLIEMVSAFSAFPNKGVRMEAHLIRKVIDRDGKILEEWNNESSRVTSEYAAGTMVEMMQGVVRGGGTANGASAGGHPLAGKTGTVNDHTDVWFVGYTPTYTTGIWMGNPLRKESLGKYMTGGHGAVPYFNSFMIPFMKDKPRERFPSVPAMPTELRALNEQRKREQIEKLERADEIGRRLGILYGTKNKNVIPKTGPVDSPADSSDSNSAPTSAAPPTPKPVDDDKDTPPPPKTGTDAPTPKKPEVPKVEEPKPDETTKRTKKGEKDER